jgi:hypothetical protein
MTKINWNGTIYDLRGVPEVFVEDPEDPGNYITSKIYVGETDPAVGGDVPYVWMKPSDISSAGGITFDDTGLTVVTGSTVQDALEAVDTEFAFASYTPTFTQVGALTTSSLVARYVQIGKLVFVYVNAVFSSAGTAGTSITTSLPVTASTGGMSRGVGQVTDAGTGDYTGFTRFTTATAATIVHGNANTIQGIGQNPSFAVASGDTLTMTAIYEAA